MWTPKEIRKLLALLAGIGLEIAGIILLVNQVQSTGTIDITSSLVSGKVQSGSAGIFLCFIGLVIITLSIIGGKEITHYEKANGSQKEVTEVTVETSQKRGMIAIFAMAALTISLLLGGDFLVSKGFQSAGLLSLFGAFAGFITGVLIIVVIVSYLDSSTTEDAVDTE